MKRLDIGEGTYALELEEDVGIMDAVSRVQTMVLENEHACLQFKAQYASFEYLWKEDLQATLSDFIDQNGNDGEDPPLELFDHEIAKYKKIQEQIQTLQATCVIGWLKIDAKPIKQALATWVTKVRVLRLFQIIDDLFAHTRPAKGRLPLPIVRP